MGMDAVSYATDGRIWPHRRCGVVLVIYFWLCFMRCLDS